MPNFTAQNTTVSVKVGDLCDSILRELGVTAQGENSSAGNSNWVLENLQRRIDLVNAQRQLIYAETFPVFNLLTNTQPITIGPGGQFVLPAPPIRIVGCSLILTGGVEIEMQMLTEAQWEEVSIKGLTSTIAVALYYERQFPLGNLYFWPVPTQANQVRLRIWQNLPQALSLVTALALPPAYWAYLVCAGAFDSAVSYGMAAMQRVGSEVFKSKYREALNAIKDNNADVPPLKSGVPSGHKGSVIPDFNFLTGFSR